MAMRVILDTNIIISLEDNSPIPEQLSLLVALLQGNGVKVLVHPSSIDDVQNDKDDQRRLINLSKLKKYPQVEAPPSLDPNIFTAVNIVIGGSNDVIDCTILTALAKDAAHFFITEDRKLKGKAKRLKIADRVLTIEEAFTLFSVAFAKQTVDLPNLEFVFVHQIRDELGGEFFDSLREDYEHFDAWFINSCQEARQAWIARDSSGYLGALCIIKDELNEAVSSTCRLSGRILKLCTFKVDQTVRGQKIGELLLKAAFRHATINGHQHIYVTAKVKQNELIDLLTDFGFDDVGLANNGDTVFVKDHPSETPKVDIPAFDYHVQYAPHFRSGPGVNKFLVPIQPLYHSQLFPDAGEQLKLGIPGFNPGNAIKIAYLCNAKTKSIKTGDVLIFYRSGDWKQCTTIGIVESAERLADTAIILERVLRRTVYTQSKIDDMSKDGCLVVLFRLQGHFPVRVGMEDLTKFRIKGALQSIRKIKDEQFKKIAERGKIENCIFTD